MHLQYHNVQTHVISIATSYYISVIRTSTHVMHLLYHTVQTHVIQLLLFTISQ